MHLIFRGGDVGKRRDGLTVFFALVFGYTWGLAGLYRLFPAGVTATLGPVLFSNPVLVSAVSSPLLAALILASFQGRATIADLIARLLTWRIAWYWYVGAVVGIAALAFVVRIASMVAFGSPLPQFSVAQLPALLVGVRVGPVFVFDPGPFGEELGWRGFALPRLLERWNGLTAALVLGMIWGVWHLPAFFIPAMPQTQVSLFRPCSCSFENVLETWNLTLHGAPP